eukprot:TRINITY_DN7637_c0_g1_i1.p2 TRINITY_DN7637_c0_g1~~TRINITY_DN7637_c0_g1_i1.p2  ORF type:complete len:118 (-),score=6.76 TRINITY_DN7637_c0_g1_i1:170-523(-)
MVMHTRQKEKKGEGKHVKKKAHRPDKDPCVVIGKKPTIEADYRKRERQASNIFFLKQILFVFLFFLRGQGRWWGREKKKRKKNTAGQRMKECNPAFVPNNLRGHAITGKHSPPGIPF